MTTLSRLLRGFFDYEAACPHPRTRAQQIAIWYMFANQPARLFYERPFVGCFRMMLCQGRVLAAVAVIVLPLLTLLGTL
jgi:hypothetical protein